MLGIQSIFYNDEFQSEPKLVDIDNDGDLDKLVIGAFHYGYSFDRYIFEYIPNHSNEIDSFDFDSFIGVGEVCSSGQRRWCLTSFNFGDIDDDGDNDVLYLSTNTLYNYVDGSLTDRSVDFKLFERNQNNVDPLFEEAITNPFNLETIGNTLNLDSNTILEIFLNDVNMDGQNDISVLTLDMEEDSIPGVLNYHLQLKTFYKSSNDPVLFDENEHLIWSFNGQYAYDVDFYESSDIDPFGYLLNSFFVYSNIYLIDLDNDGDQDIFMREVKFYYSPDNYEYEVGYNTQLYYFENQSIVNSVEEMEKELNIKVYPNPIHDNFHIQLDEALNGTVEFVLYNSNGSKVYTKTLTGNNIAIERKNLPSGIYFYKLINDQQVFSGSLILQ
ncbi:MAG: T9SS type A sorting domain-containing protein [Chitinophagales bacterium]